MAQAVNKNLNAENLINEIQSLIKTLKATGGWVKRGNGEGWFNHEILEDALALINELTKERTDHLSLIDAKDVIINDLNDKHNRLLEENERLRAELEQRPPKLIITKKEKKG